MKTTTIRGHASYVGWPLAIMIHLIIVLARRSKHEPYEITITIPRNAPKP